MTEHAWTWSTPAGPLQPRFGFSYWRKVFRCIVCAYKIKIKLGKSYLWYQIQFLYVFVHIMTWRLANNTTHISSLVHREAFSKQLCSSLACCQHMLHRPFPFSNQVINTIPHWFLTVIKLEWNICIWESIPISLLSHSSITTRKSNTMKNAVTK